MIFDCAVARSLRLRPIEWNASVSSVSSIRHSSERGNPGWGRSAQALGPRLRGDEDGGWGGWAIRGGGRCSDRDSGWPPPLRRLTPEQGCGGGGGGGIGGRDHC